MLSTLARDIVISVLAFGFSACCDFIGMLFDDDRTKHKMDIEYTIGDEQRQQQRSQSSTSIGLNIASSIFANTSIGLNIASSIFDTTSIGLVIASSIFTNTSSGLAIAFSIFANTSIGLDIASSIFATTSIGLDIASSIFATPQNIYMATTLLYVVNPSWNSQHLTL
jgi:hypothetical protein